MDKKNIISQDGFINRKNTPLPKEKCIMEIINYNAPIGEEILLCEWEPYSGEHAIGRNVGELPSTGYLGTACTIDQKINIGFHAWQQNESEFIYYKLIKPSVKTFKHLTHGKRERNTCLVRNSNADCLDGRIHWIHCNM